MAKMIWGTPVEAERRRRIFLSVWAYADVFMNNKIVTIEEFDYEARMVNLDIDTGDAALDAWWKENFKVGRNDWICKHPYKKELHVLAIRLLTNRGNFTEDNLNKSPVVVIENARSCPIEPKKKEEYPQEEAA